MQCCEIINGRVSKGISAVYNEQNRYLVRLGNKKNKSKLRTIDLTHIVSEVLPGEIKSKITDVVHPEFPEDAVLILIRNQAGLKGNYRIKHSKFKILANGYCAYDIFKKTGNGNEYLAILFNNGFLNIKRTGILSYNNTNRIVNLKNINGKLLIKSFQREGIKNIW